MTKPTDTGKRSPQGELQYVGGVYVAEETGTCDLFLLRLPAGFLPKYISSILFQGCPYVLCFL